MADAAQSKISLYYDGLCHLCSREINHYRKMAGSEKIRFVDITALDFRAESENLDPTEIHKVIHVRDRQGQIHKGVDAFICIWSELTALKKFVSMTRFGLVYWALNAAYSIFAHLRPMLPRKSCEASPYCEIKKHDLD